MLEGESTFVMVPFRSKLEFVIFVSDPADIRTSVKISAINIKIRPFVKIKPPL
jgi:hypothetical protein